MRAVVSLDVKERSRAVTLVATSITEVKRFSGVALTHLGIPLPATQTSWLVFTFAICQTLVKGFPTDGAACATDGVGSAMIRMKSR